MKIIGWKVVETIEGNGVWYRKIISGKVEEIRREKLRKVSDVEVGEIKGADMKGIRSKRWENRECERK